LAVALAGCGSSSGGSTAAAPPSHAATVGNAPPEWPANADSWPAHNYDLSNTRATTNTDINATNVSKLKPKWRFKLPYVGEFGAYASNPIVLGGVVYIQDPDSDVYALNQQTGAVMWKHIYKSPTPSGGPNGLALGYGLLYGATEGSAFALDPRNGKQLWMHKLTNNVNEGIDMAPQLYDGKVLISTIPGSSTNFYHPGALGIVYSLQAKTGKTIWKFNTIKGGYKLFGNPKVNSGGGLWYPPSVDSSGRVFMGVANPAPYPGTPKFPNGSSHPGPDLYTDSLVALDGATGKLLWFQQVTPHDFRDYDFQVAPIVRSQMINGTSTETVIGAGKSGKVVAFRADNGKRLWTRNVGIHMHDSGPFPLKKAVCYEPGFLGGVETPMAASGKPGLRPLGRPLLQRNGHGDQERRRPQRRDRRPRCNRLRNGQGRLDESPAEPRLWRGHGRQRRRLHRHARRHDLRLRHEDRQDPVDHQRPRRHQLLPGGHQEHADHRRRRFGRDQEPGGRDRRLFAEPARGRGEDAVHTPAADSASLDRRQRSERQLRFLGGRQERNGPGQGR